MQLIRLRGDGGPTDYARDVMDFTRYDKLRKNTAMSDLECLAWMAMHPPMRGESGTMTGYLQTHVIDHSNGKTSFTMPGTVALALCTVVPDSSKTGNTITEANYTGYVRPTIAGSGFNAAVAGGAGVASTTSTAGAITGGNCSGGSSVIIGWMLLDSSTVGAGNGLWWGTATSTTISTVQTPPTIASGGLTESLL